jgi:hypothetical protein
LQEKDCGGLVCARIAGSRVCSRSHPSFGRFAGKK